MISSKIPSSAAGCHKTACRVDAMTGHGSNSTRQNIPAFIKPCLATLPTKAPQGERWVHEIKFDGYRLQARIENGKAQLVTRNGLDWTHRFPGLAKVLASLKLNSAIIDGEAIAETDAGASDFALLANALKLGNSERIVYLRSIFCI
jgi:bifunctional non-homologous end joining protein LigD